jgi:Domain of unknown function (DUF4156)
MKNQRMFSALLALVVVISGCGSTPLEPEKIKVKVEREAPSDKDCKEIGTVTGSTLTMKGTSSEAIEDLKQEAARKGANYVHLHNFSAVGSAVQGTAYFCP